MASEDLATQDEGSLRDALSAAYDKAETPDTVAAPAAPIETAEQKADRARDDAGRFAKIEAKEPAPIADIPAAPAPGTRKAPSSWKAEAQAAWSKVDRGEPLTPDETKLLVSEAERREGDFHKGIEGFKTHADLGRAYEKTLAPYQSTLQSLKVDGVTAVGELLKVDAVLRNAPPAVKAQKLMELANSYGIDLNQQFAPDVARYQQELYQTQQQLQEIRRQNEDFTHTSLNSEIERFKSTPGHEHFDSVREDMAALLSGGRASDMDQAYEMAVYANPQTREQILAKERSRVADETASARARTAAVSIRGSSPASGQPAAQEHKTIRDSLMAAYDQHQS